MDTNISFDDLAIKMSDVLNKKITKKDFDGWVKSNVKVQRYIPVSEKYAVANIFARDFLSDMKGKDISTDLDFIFFKYELMSVMSILFYYTNISIKKENKNSKNYDLIMQSGFYDYLTKLCGKDYEKFINICNKISGIDTLTIMQQFVTFIGKQPSLEEFEKIADIINNDIDKEKLNIINDIQAYNNPVIKKISKTISENSAKEVTNKD